MGTPKPAKPKGGGRVRAMVTDREGRVLLVKRPEDKENHPGLWSLPGGRKDDDESPYQSAVRELLEETGLSAQPDGREYCTEVGGHEVVAFGFDQPSGTLRLDLEESDRARWFAPDDLPDDLHPGTAEMIAGILSQPKAARQTERNRANGANSAIPDRSDGMFFGTGSDITSWPNWPPSVRAVVLNDQAQVLLLKRAENAKLFPGLWNLPGGAKEDGETFYAAAVRELLEESGLSAQPDGRSHSFGFPGGYGVAFGFARPSGSLLVDLQESEKAGWFDPRKLPAKLMPGTAGILSAFVGYDVDPERQKEDQQHGAYVDSSGRDDAATPYADLPILRDREHSNQDEGTLWRIRKWASSDGSADKDKIDWDKYARAFFWVDPDHKHDFGGYKLKFADVVQGKLVAVPRGVFSAAALIQGSRGGVDMPEADRAKVKAHIAHYYRKMAEVFNDRGIVPPWEKEGRTDSLERGVHRIDRGAVGSVEMTRQGFMRVDGYATRIGVFTYVLPNGTIRRELRHPDDVLKADSLATLIGVPVTDEHPPVMVDARNSRTYARGMTGDSVQPQPDGRILVGLTVTDGGLIQRIDDGSQVELSSGYDCDLLMQPGEWQGQRYDARQMNITYNHLAVTRKGRAGPEVGLRLDAAEQVDGDHETEDPMAGEVPGDKTTSMGVDALTRKVDAISAAFAKFIKKTKKKSKKKGKKADAARRDAKKARKDARRAAKSVRKAGQTITITDPDGDAKVTKTGADCGPGELNHVGDRADALPAAPAGKKARKAAERERGRADALEAQLKKRLDGMGAEVNERAKARINLLTTAAGIVDRSIKLDALSDREIKIAVVKAVNADADPSKWSADYLQGAFDGAVKAAGGRVDSAAAAARLIESVQQRDAADHADSAAQARARREQESQAAWSKPVGRHRAS